MATKRKPDKHDRAIKALEADLNDRRGLHLDSLDNEVRREIFAKWRKILTEIYGTTERQA